MPGLTSFAKKYTALTNVQDESESDMSHIVDVVQTTDTIPLKTIITDTSSEVDAIKKQLQQQQLTATRTDTTTDALSVTLGSEGEGEGEGREEEESSTLLKVSSGGSGMV